jgi:hypothetical protein
VSWYSWSTVNLEEDDKQMSGGSEDKETGQVEKKWILGLEEVLLSGDGIVRLEVRIGASPWARFAGVED